MNFHLSFFHFWNIDSKIELYKKIDIINTNSMISNNTIYKYFMNAKKYKSHNKTKDLETIVAEYGNDKIDLNPIYQRDVVWNVNKMKGFINSCYRGIIPSPIMISSTDEKDICVDGKQRITTLIKFYNNDFSFKFDEDDKDEYFYSEIHEDYSEKDNYHVLTDKDRKRIDKLCMNILEYDNLEYVDQVQIFYRIQQGVSLKAGEKIIAMFHEHKLAAQFSSKSKEFEDILSKYYKTERNDHILFLTNVMFMIHENKCVKATESQRRMFLKKLDSIKFLKKIATIPHKYVWFLSYPFFIDDINSSF
jgi:hypothetical protein